MLDPVRFALLGAASITPKAFVQPSTGLATITGIAARSEERAVRFASTHGIKKAYPDYETALGDPDVEAVYLATPAALHAPWVRRALRAHKHVLCEKPFALSEAEARSLVDEAEQLGLVLMEAHHSRFHALWTSFVRAVGALPDVTRVEAVFDAPIAEAGDIRHDPALGAGVFLDFGGYLLIWLSWILEARGAQDPWAIQITRASAVARPHGVDRTMQVEALLDGGTRIPATLTCSMEPSVRFQARIEVYSSTHSVIFENPLALQGSHVTEANHGPIAPSLGASSTYRGQLEAFVKGVRTGASVRHTGRDIVHLARLVDRVYEQAGLPGRYSFAHTSS
jgi:predicted dehydrogenase